VETAAGDFDPELPDRPLPDVDLPDESGWLYDSGRDYFDQLAHYKSHKNGDAT
jgi:hypothetical protein